MSEYEQARQQYRAPASGSSFGKQIAVVVLLLVVGAGCFYGGVAYQKGHQKTAGTNTNMTAFGGTRATGGPGGGMMGGFGTVTAISATSITVESSQTSTSTTYVITSATKVTDNGSTSSVSAIQTGDTVIVQPESSSAKTAATIVLNPSMSGAPGAPTASN